ncbi:MAG: hypothetical protein OEX97_04615 [Acidimicrobiia bacterium]|nr:hypothetical protein [Acidimicrobiia bacterium]
MRRFFVLLVVAFVVLSALPAVAMEPEDVVAELDFRNYAAETGTSIDINALEDLIEETEAAERGLFFVVLRSDPAGGNDLFAARLIDLQLRGTVVVISRNEIGAASTAFDDEALVDAVDAAFAHFEDGDDIGALEAFADALPGGAQLPAATTPAVNEPAPSAQPASSGGGGGGFVLIFILAIVGLIGFAIWRGSRKSKEAAEGRLNEAKGELSGQLSVIANEILELSDRVTFADNEKASEQFREANETYTEVSQAAEAATTLAALEAFSDRLDRARWQLESAEAMIEGRAVPAEPEDRPAHCFFDPAHRAGVEEAEIKTAAGSQTVGVCRDCASKLRSGETPTPRSINVGGRPIPAPQAPRSHGGGGFDWLGAFSILLGGRGGDGVSYDLGSTRGVQQGAGSSRGSVLGRLGSRSSDTAPINQPRSSSRSNPPRRTTPTPPSRTTRRTTPTSPPEPKPEIKGRARRRRK